MGDKDVDDFINRYPLNLFHKTERALDDPDAKVIEKVFHYETLTANYIYTHYPYSMSNYTTDTTDTCEIYIQRVHEGIEKILSMQDGNGEPTYSIKGITPKLFRSPFKIRAKTILYIIYR